MSAAILTPEEFARAWGDDALTRLPIDHANVPIPAGARAFLVQAGLPNRITFHAGETGSELTFERLKSGMSSILSEKTVGPPLPRNWSIYWVLGDEYFSNGWVWWCIHQNDGHILRIDGELADPIQFVNTSTAHFAS